MPYSGKIFYRKHPEATLKELKRAAKHELRTLVFDWHGGTLADHFKPSAMTKYRYAKRTEKYLKNKKNVKGHQNPLVYTGHLKRMALQQISVSGSSKKATGRMTVPKYLFYRNGAVDMKKEIVAVSKTEVTLMAKKMHDRVGKRLDEAKVEPQLRLRRF